MARPASMTADEAVAALGPRGNLIVTSNNRGTVKKWLVANGLPSLFVGGLSMIEMAIAYNETDGSGLDKLRAKLAKNCDADDADAEPAPVPAPAPVVTNGHANGNGNDLATIRDLLLQGYKPGLDRDAVEAIVSEKLTELGGPSRRIEIVAPTGTTVIDGHSHNLLPDMIVCLSQRIPVALIGPAGSGKTTAVEQAAKALGLPFYMNGAVSGAHEYLGFVDAHGNYQSTPFRQAFEHGGVYCADELDAGDPCAILVINSALANGHMPFPDKVEPVAKHPDFIIVACANTFGLGADRQYVGRNQLDAATLDRFAMFHWNYDETLEAAICANEAWLVHVQAVRHAIAEEKGARLIVSPRASIYGARLIAAGMPQARVAELVIWKGTDADTRRRIETRMGVA